MEFITTVASSVLSSLASSAAKSSGSTVFSRVSERSNQANKMSIYLKRLSNLTMYSVAYRASSQSLDESYVEPRLINSALVLTHLDPLDYKRIDMIPSNAFKNTKTQYIHQLDIISAHQLIDSTQNIVLLGDAGDGKTSFLCYLLWNRLRKKRPKFPVFVNSASLRTKDLTECINDCLGEAGLPNSQSYLLRSARNTILYIDGLDELTIEKQNKTYLLIDDLSKAYPDLRICIAIRSAAYRGQLSYMRELTLAPFDRVQISEFIAKWHSYPDLTDKGRRLNLMIESNERLAELASKPLFLNLICNAHRRYLDLSQRPSALFSQCIDTLMWDWDARRDVERSNLFSCLDIEKKRMIHARIASEMHSERVKYWNYNQIMSFLVKELPRFSIPEQESRAVLEQICSNHCIYVKHTEDCFGFAHNALQEYLTAEWLKFEKRWVDLLNSSLCSDPWWEHVTYLTVSSMGDASEALIMLYENENLESGRRLWLCANCLKFDPVVDPSIREMIIRRVLSLFHNGNSAERNLALSILTGWRDGWTSEIVKRSLGSQLPNKENWTFWG